jgi:hypothetical protein
MGIIYTLYFAPSQCVNYRTPRLLTNEALEGIARTTIANFNAWTYNGISENELK